MIFYADLKFAALQHLHDLFAGVVWYEAANNVFPGKVSVLYL